MQSKIYYYNSKTLYIKEDFNEELTDIPEETLNLIFDESSKYNLSIDNLPKNIKKIKLGFSFNKQINNLPDNLKEITLSQCFNKKIDFLPKNLTHLTSNTNFNKKINHLPQNLTHLVLGPAFNQKVDYLPKNLTHINFLCEFNKSVKKLPKNITHLEFGRYFNQSIKKLPKNITHLSVNYYFNQSILHLQNLTSLKYYNYLQPNRSIPYTIKELQVLSEDLNSPLPNFIEKLSIMFIEDKKYNASIKKSLETCTNLKELSFEFPYFHLNDDSIIKNLPNNLTHLKYFENTPLINIPKNIKSLCLSSDNNLLNNMPEHIEKIFIKFDYKIKEINNLPLTIKEIVIEEEYFSEYIKIPYGTILTIQKIE